MLGTLAGLPALGGARVWAAPSSVSLLDYIPLEHQAAIAAGQSEWDAGPALATALAVARGTVEVPAGRYVIKTPVRFTPALTAGRFVPGPAIVGAGIGRSIFVNAANGAAMIDIDAGTTLEAGFRAIAGTRLEAFTITGDGRAGADAAIRLRSCYQARLSQLHIVDQRGDGIRIPCTLGDDDGSNMITIDQVRIENCAGWGIDTSASSGRNENSFVDLRHVFVQNCGTPSPSKLPPSGGMRHKGQLLGIRQSAFTINANVGLFIPGEAGLCVGVTIEDTAFENNHGRHLLCTGIDGFRATQMQMFSNDANRVTTGCEFLGESYLVRNVRLEGVIVRATPANSPNTAFAFSGQNLGADSCSIDNVSWEQYDAPGQRRYEGVAISRHP